MFTVKAFYRDSDSYQAYEANQYMANHENHGEVVFHEPYNQGVTTTCLGVIFNRIVVENAAGKTVENMTYHLDLPREKMESMMSDTKGF